MLIEFLFELKNSINRHGIRWGVIFAIYAVFRKETRNYRLDKRDREHNSYFRAILENQQILMKRLEVEPCADTSTLITQISAQNTERGYTSSIMEKLLARYAAQKEIWLSMNWSIRRNDLMLNKAWLVGLIGYVGYFVKMSFGIEVTDDLVDKLSDFVLLAAAVIPMVVNMIKHKKEGEISEPTQYTNTFESNR